MRREQTIELTPLLDVILILLFGFMINMSSTLVAKDAVLQEALEENQRILEVSRERREATGRTLDLVADWFGLEEALLEVLEPETLAALADPSLVADQLQKYQSLGRHYVFLDIRLHTSLGKVYLNGEDTGVHLLPQELSTAQGRAAKRQQLEELLAETLAAQPGGFTFVLLSLGEDGQVLRVQYNLAWEAMRSIQARHSMDRVFLTRLQNITP
ncbi:hypothetical protein [Anaerotalea alkaliphila]|uniref:Uncharacterized protein n=1 Tax=Anaerotalea alkaliphila TaxID=2662126 RepID=A0A7X5HV05_9FIRM|nr:hypothetical protein [Anaerotalea alkaliphila]NDL67155.1 hypothetical protein [Anaerotalea alkaliphila]